LGIAGLGTGCGSAAYAAFLEDSADVSALCYLIVYIYPYVAYFNNQSFWYLENISNKEEESSTMIASPQ
jgi:hypothetical protein